MLEAVSEIMGMQVYTPGGIYLGNVDNLIMDMDNCTVNGIFLKETNPLLVEGSRSVNIPYRWIQSIGDVVILKYFPNRVAVAREEIVEF
ncbi:MAG: PRC-barrel domain-containing protein [Methanomassiliicoccales archaeon]|nr:MAG: PRC-barrel domain-containing protein [Methanomassiliicoccales archaeon]